MAIPGTEIDFEIEKEDWNVYNLDDGTILKMRSVLTRIVSAPMPIQIVPQQQKDRSQSTPDLSFNSSFNNIVVVQKSPIGLMGSPQEPPYDFEGSDKIEVGYTAFKEDWNIYRISGVGIPKGFKMRVKLVVSSISRVIGLHDQFGYPIYIVNSTNAVVPVAPSPPRRR